AQSNHERTVVWGIQTGNHHKSVVHCIARRLAGRQRVPSPSKTSATLVSPWFELGPDGAMRNGLHKPAIAAILEVGRPMRRWGPTLAHCSSHLQAQFAVLSLAHDMSG